VVVGGTGVFVGGTGVFVGGTGVAVGSTCTAPRLAQTGTMLLGLSVFGYAE
jgi:hypothetical protein